MEQISLKTSNWWKSLIIISILDMWDDEVPVEAEPLSAGDLAVLQGCREFGRVVRISRKTKLVEVEVNTMNKSHTLQYDMTKFGMDFVPWPGKKWVTNNK